MLHARQVFASLKNPKLVLSLFVTTMIIQIATGSIAPILTLYVRDLAGATHNGVYQRADRLGARRRGVDERPTAGQAGRSHRPGAHSDMYADRLGAVADPDGLRANAVAARGAALSAGAADGALLPAVQTLLIYNCTNQVAGRIFSYNQSFRDVGNVSGPLLVPRSPPATVFARSSASPLWWCCSTPVTHGGVCGGGRATCGKTRCRKNNSCIYRQFPPLAGSTPRFPTFNNASFGPANFRPTRNILTSTSCLSTIN